jgi:hypothetical protein
VKDRLQRFANHCQPIVKLPDRIDRSHALTPTG